MKSESAAFTVLVSTGLTILAFAIVSSLLSTVGTIGEEWRTVGILRANPDYYTQWMPTILEYGIIPICVGLSLYSISLKLQKLPFKRNDSLLLLIFGGFVAAWGILHSLATYHSYSKAIRFVNDWNVKGIEGSLQIIYIGYGCIGFLLIVSGVLISATGYFRQADRKVCEGDQDVKL